MAAKKQSTNTKAPVWQVVVNSILLVVAVLLFVAVQTDTLLIKADYAKLTGEDMTALKALKLDFPPLDNPIGPFGALFAQYLIWFFGKFTAIVFCAWLAVFCALNIFIPHKTIWKLKVICAGLLGFFINIILFTKPNWLAANTGFFTLNFFNLLNRIFKPAGSIIVLAALSLFMVLVIFEVRNINVFLGAVFKTAWKVISSLFRVAFASKKNKPKAKTKPQKQKPAKVQESEDDEPAFTEEKEMQIYDHAYSGAGPDDLPEPAAKLKKKRPKPITTIPEFDVYTKPDIDEFLENPVNLTKRDKIETEEEIRVISQMLKEKLAEFNIESQVMNVNIGPVITQYEIKPAPGVKVSRFTSLTDDLALAIKARSIRVQAPIPGRGLIGIELPNHNRDIIYLKDVMLSDEAKKIKGPLCISLGKDIAGNPVATDLARMPHLLIAGATGAGKSVCINTLINCLLLQKTPDELRFIMIDPKRIELSGYEGIPHLIQNVVTDSDDALAALNWGVEEMERRYELLQKYRVRDIKGYNGKIAALQKNKKDTDESEEPEDVALPYIVIIVDEFADLIMTAGKDIELPIARLAQKARAIGIHLILATQRPSSKVITGIIKANFPSRISFQVSSKIDSRVILDENGAERLLGRGDMLFLPPGRANAERIHGAFISDEEIENLVEYLRKQPKPDYQIEIISEETAELGDFSYDDELFPEAAHAIVSAGTASVSMLQRHFKIGYARAGRLVDMLERGGVIGPHVGSKSRDVLLTHEDLEKMGL